MSKRFVFFVSAAYCYPIFRPIQEEIWRQGHEVAWFFVKGLPPQLTSNEKLLQNENEVRTYSPDAVFGAADWIPHYLPGLKVMVFHGLSINKRGTEKNVHYRIRDWYDLYCTHAEEDTKIFKELAKEHKNFQVKCTGWPKLDTLFNYKNEHIKNNKDKTLFFASTFSPSITAAPYVVNELKKISKIQGWQVVATLHPLMDPEIVDRYKAMQSNSFTFLSADDDLYQAMSKADVMLCDTSSIMYEFMFLNKPVITYKTKNSGPFITDVKKVEDIFPAIQKLLDNPEDQLKASQEVCNLLHCYQDGASSKRVVNSVIETLDTNNQLKPRKPSLIRRLKLRKRMNYWGL